jgi:hypothetical protein
MKSNKADIGKLLLKYKAAFSNTELTKEKLTLYTELLQDIPMEKIEKAMIECAKTLKFFPSVSEIRKEANKIPTIIYGDGYEEIDGTRFY